MTRRNYTDHEIACYVLGLKTSIPAQDIEHALAHDNAAAARALKWETYFLCVVDALPQHKPSKGLLAHIEQSLGMEPSLPEELDADPPMHALAQDRPDHNHSIDAQPSPGQPAANPPWWRRKPIAVALAVVISAMVLLVAWGVTRDVPRQEVSQTLTQSTPQPSEKTSP